MECENLQSQLQAFAKEKCDIEKSTEQLEIKLHLEEKKWVIVHYTQ